MSTYAQVNWESRNGSNNLLSGVHLSGALLRVQVRESLCVLCSLQDIGTVCVFPNLVFHSLCCEHFAVNLFTEPDL